MAYHDAYLSHRRNGIYGAMFFSAAISAAFAVDDPIKAIRIGLTEIPKECELARQIRWALRAGKQIKDYRQARPAVDARFQGMHRVHTINNACLTVFGLMIGDLDYTKTISQIVAMGMDNDCNAATAGSIVGAIIGGKRIPKHWHRPFKNTVHSYLKGRRTFKISALLKRFSKQAAMSFCE
jgi:ADP-ribosylglycohydrolase